MSTLIEKLTAKKSSNFWVQLQNDLWECVYKAKYDKLSQLIENTSLNLPFLANPNQSEIIERSLRNCLQTLLYVTWLERSNQHEIIMAENIKIDTRESFHVLYWAVMNRSSEFMRGFLMTDLLIEEKHTLIVKHMLDLLIQNTDWDLF